ncbi:MAG: hypothetical protein AABZ23_06380 [Deltaproteobacteria bacterium]
MSTSGTIRAITRNLQKVLQGLGIYYSVKASDDAKDLAASNIPVGEIQYEGEGFEDAFGQRPGYIDAGFAIKVLFVTRSHADIVREQQDWTHKIRSALTVDALNSDELSLGKNVSRVTILKAEAVNRKNISSINLKINIRYRTD